MTKGTRRERQTDQIYEDAGWWTYRPETTQYGDNDVFGLFDLLALGPRVEGIPSRLDMVQVKSDAARGIEQWREDTLPFQCTLGLRPLMAVCYKYEGWRVIIPLGDGDHATIIDERDSDANMGEEWREYLEGCDG